MIIIVSLLFSSIGFAMQTSPAPTDLGGKIITQGLDFIEAFLREKLGQQTQTQPTPTQQYAPPPPPVPISPVTTAQANQASVDACVTMGMDPATCQALGGGGTTSSAISQLSADDRLFSDVQDEIKIAQARGETVYYLDLNFSDLMIVSFLQMLFDRMNLLDTFRSKTVATLTVIPMGASNISSLISKANLPKATALTPMDPNDIAKLIMPRFSTIKFSMDAYASIYTSIGLKSSKKGGVVLVSTLPGVNQINGRIRIIPHPDTKTLLGNFVEKVSGQLDMDLITSH